MNKEDVVHMHSGILLSCKKEWNSAICSNIDEPRDYPIKRSKSETDKQHDTTYVESKKGYKWTYLQNRNRHMNLENRCVATKGERWKRRNKLGGWD